MEGKEKEEKKTEENRSSLCSGITDVHVVDKHWVLGTRFYLPLRFLAFLETE